MIASMYVTQNLFFVLLTRRRRRAASHGDARAPRFAKCRMDDKLGVTKDILALRRGLEWRSAVVKACRLRV